jgi:hypothetical protein
MVNLVQRYIGNEEGAPPGPESGRGWENRKSKSERPSRTSPALNASNHAEKAAAASPSRPTATATAIEAAFPNEETETSSAASRRSKAT